MAKRTKAPAWALALAASVSSKAPTKKIATTKKTSSKATKASKKTSKKKTVTIAPGLLARVLASASGLQRTEPVWLACERRLNDLVDDVRGDTTALAKLLGVDRRSAQRLRAAYGIERRLVDGVWQ